MTTPSTRKQNRRELWFAAGSGLLSLSALLACVFKVFYGSDPWDAQFAIGLGTLSLCGMACYWIQRRLLAYDAEARLYLQRLASESFDSLPAIAPHSPWLAVLHQIHDKLQASATRIADAEHARAAADVRYRRSMADHERLTRVLAHVAEPVLAVDAYDGILLANRPAEDLLGLAHDTAEKRTLAQLRRCDKLVALLKDTQRRKVASTRYEDMELDDSHGGKRWYHVTARSLTRGECQNGAQQEIEGVVAVLRDITSERQIQQQHAEFVSSASHEMKAPLAGIRAYVELLADGEAEDEQTREEFLRVINSQTDRLQRLVENLLNIARIEAGVVKVQKQPLGLNDLLAEACNVVQPTADAGQIALRAELSPMYLSAFCDRDLILQTAINLLSNAIKYTHRGGQITLRSRLLDDMVQFEVEDTGVGLSEEDCRKVFEKFYRVAKDQAMASGTGLGLPLAKYIVEDVHGGSLTVRSKLGVGSTFVVTIPSASRGN